MFAANPKISVITVCRNSEGSILDTIMSVNRQSYVNLEHIFVDGMSDDNTVRIIKKNSKYISTLIREADSGIYDALNKGIKAATGDIISILHSDDIFASKYVLEQVIDAFDEGGNNVVYGDLQYVHQSSPERVTRSWVAGAFTESSLRWGWMPPHTSVYIAKPLHDVVGMYDPSFRISGDYDFLFRLFQHPEARPTYLRKTLISMRTGGVSNKNFSAMRLKWREDWRVINAYKTGGAVTLAFKSLRKIGQLRPLARVRALLDGE